MVPTPTLASRLFRREKNKPGLSHILTLVITAFIWLMNKESYTQEREKARQGDGGIGATGKALIMSKGKAILCSLWNKKLFNEMILANQPTCKMYTWASLPPPARRAERGLGCC